MSSEKSYGVALILSALFGPLGADKFYVGATGLGITQLVLSLTLIGLLISVPWAQLSTFTLTLAILFGTATFLYPSVNWAPLTSTDKTIAWIVVSIYVLGVISSSAKSVERWSDDTKSDE